MKSEKTPLAPVTLEIPENSCTCQIGYLPQMSTGRAKVGRHPISLRLKLLLSHRTRRYLSSKYHFILAKINHIIGKDDKAKKLSADFPILNLRAGEMVHVRLWEEIQKTLDHRNDFKGCGFMLTMKQYCGTAQRVMKPVERFIDERDLRLHKSSGVVLLDGLICEGDERFGRCDRSCYFFWREEWLERVARFPSMQPAPTLE